MPDLLNPNQPTLKATKKISLVHVMTCSVMILVFLMILFFIQTSSKPTSRPFIPKRSNDLTGVYYGYSQLSNIEPIYWQLRVIQPKNSVDFTGEFLLLNSSTYPIKGTEDDHGNIQFVLNMSAKSNAMGIPGSDLITSLFNGGSKSKTISYHFIGYWKKTRRELLLSGVVVNLSPVSEEDTKPLKFYASTIRSNFWGKRVN
jgi:hypothetical protein